MVTQFHTGICLVTEIFKGLRVQDEFMKYQLEFNLIKECFKISSCTDHLTNMLLRTASDGNKYSL